MEEKLGAQHSRRLPGARSGSMLVLTRVLRAEALFSSPPFYRCENRWQELDRLLFTTVFSGLWSREQVPACPEPCPPTLGNSSLRSRTASPSLGGWWCAQHRPAPPCPPLPGSSQRSCVEEQVPGFEQVIYLSPGALQTPCLGEALHKPAAGGRGPLFCSFLPSGPQCCRLVRVQAGCLLVPRRLRSV